MRPEKVPLELRLDHAWHLYRQRRRGCSASQRGWFDDALWRRCCEAAGITATSWKAASLDTAGLTLSRRTARRLPWDSRMDTITCCWLSALAAAGGLPGRSSYWLARASRTFRPAKNRPN